MTRFHRGQATNTWGFLLPAIVFLGLEGCATTLPGSFGGTEGPVAWRVEDIEVQGDAVGERVKWSYIVKLHNTGGIKLHLNHLTGQSSGRNVRASVSELDIDLHLDPGEEISIPCWASVTSSHPGGTFHPSTLTVSRTYSGRDEKGGPVQVTLDIPLDLRMPRRKPTLVDFVRVSAQPAGNAQLWCETIPKETKVFDPSRHDAVHLIIGINNVQRPVPVRTRWISPLGEEIKDIVPIGLTPRATMDSVARWPGPTSPSL